MLLSLRTLNFRPHSSSRRLVSSQSQSKAATPASMLYDVFRVYPRVKEGTYPLSCIISGEVTVRDLLAPHNHSLSQPSSASSRSSTQRNPHDIHVRDVLSLSIQSRAQQRSRAGAIDHSRKECLIIPRGDALLLKLGHVKAVCWADEALLFDSHRPDVQRLASDLDDTLQQASSHDEQFSTFVPNDEDTNSHPNPYNTGRTVPPSPSAHFELLFLESVLRDLCDSWQRRLRLYRPVVSGLLSQAGLDADAEAGMHQLIPLKDGLEQFKLEVDGASRCLTDLLRNDDDMLALLLTEKKLASQNNKPLDPNLHDAVELILEDYSRQLNAFHLEIEYHLRSIHSKQKVIALSLDSYRNRLIHMNVHLAVASVGLSVCSCTAGFLGMNVPNGLETMNFAFGMALGGSAVMALGVWAASRSYLQGGAMRRMVDDRAKRVRAVSRVLADMGSLEYAIRHLIDRNRQDGTGEAKDLKVSKDELKALIEKGRGGRNVSDSELELIFNILDESGDGMLQTSEFQKLNQSSMSKDVQQNSNK